MLFTPRFSKSFGFQQTMFPTHQSKSRFSLLNEAAVSKRSQGARTKVLLFFVGASLSLLSGTAYAAARMSGPVSPHGSASDSMADSPVAPRSSSNSMAVAWHTIGSFNPINYSSKNLKLAASRNTSCKAPFRYDSNRGLCRT